MKSFLAFFINNYKLSLTLMIMIAASGWMGLNKVRREARPPVDFARATITTTYAGSSPEEIEEKITIKIEEELRGIEGIRDVTSISQAGRSAISIRVDMDNADTDRVMDEIQRAVQRVKGLPADLLENPRFDRMNAKEIPIIELALIGSNQDRKRDQLARQLKLLLEDEDGVAGVSYSGYREREYQILLDRRKMEYHHVGIAEVSEAVRKRTQNIPAGFLRVPGDQHLVRVTGQIDKADEMADIVVRSNFSGNRVRIADIAQVKDGMADATVMVRVNGKPATLLTATKKADADTIRTVNDLRGMIENFKTTRLPEGYDLIVYNNEADRIQDRLDIVMSNALTGLALVLAILLIFLPGQLGWVTALSLPLALLGALALMPSLGVTFNTVTMLALIIAIGMLVDNSVVISENYARLRMEGLSRQEAATKGVHQFWLPLTATVLTTIAAFLPMLVTKGVMGEFIKWIPIMVTIALTMSLVEAFILLPSRLQFTVWNIEKYKKGHDGEASTWFDGLRRFFERFMYIAVGWRYVVFLLVGALLVGSLWASKKLNRFELFPAEDVEFYFALFEAPITTTLDETDQMAGQLAQKIYETLGEDTIRYLVSESGVQANNNNRKNGSYVGRLTIAIPIEKARELEVTQVLQKLRSIPKGSFSKLSFDKARGGPGVGSALSITFRSTHYEQMQALVDKMKQELGQVEGVVDLEDDVIRGGPEYRIEPNHARLASMNLNTQTVGAALRTALQGLMAQELTRDGDDFYINIRYNDRDRSTLSSLLQTKIMEPKTQSLIPLRSIVKINEEEGPAVRKHYNFKRAITLSSDVVPSKITSLALNNKARELLKQHSSDYPDVSVKFGGEDESRKESVSSLFNAMILALFGIFGILVFLFKSFMKPLLVLSCIPLGLVGVSWAFIAHQRPLSFFALIGVVGLAGVVVNSAIVLVSYIDEVLEEGHLDYRTALARASSQRLRAVMVTSLTTVGGLFPTAYGLGGYDSLLVPMTLALAWGLVSGTLITLLWVPCGYAVIDDMVRLSLAVIRALMNVYKRFAQLLKHFKQFLTGGQRPWTT